MLQKYTKPEIHLANPYICTAAMQGCGVAQIASQVRHLSYLALPDPVDGAATVRTTNLLSGACASVCLRGG